MMDIVDEIIDKQYAEQLTDTQVASRLGIDRVSWNRIKNRRAKFGQKFLSGVYKAYPDIFLSSKVTNRNIAHKKKSLLHRIIRIGRSN